MNQEELKEKMDLIKNEIEANNAIYVENVKYLGNIIIKDEDKQIFLVLEKELDEEGKIVNEYENCYSEDGIFLGRYIKSLDTIAIKEEYKEIDGIYQRLNDLDIEGIIDLKTIEKQQLEQIAKSIGIKENEIQSMSAIELAQKIEEKQEEEEIQEEPMLNEEETKTITNGKQEIKLGTKVDEYKTLGQVLDLDESQYSKVSIVYSERLQEIQEKGENINNTTYSFVAIKKDGTAEIINDRLKVDERTGNNSLKESIKVDANEKVRKDNKTKTRFQIIGKNGVNEGKSDAEKQTLSVEVGQYGEIKAYYGKGRTINGNENVETQIETASIKPTSLELRRLQAERKGTYKENNEKIAQEANYHFDSGEEEISIYSADGDINSLDLADYIEHNQKEIVEKIMQNEIIANSEFGPKDVEEKLQRLKKNKDNKSYSLKEIQQEIEKIEKEIEEDAGYFPERNRK